MHRDLKKFSEVFSEINYVFFCSNVRLSTNMQLHSLQVLVTFALERRISGHSRELLVCWKYAFLLTVRFFNQELEKISLMYVIT